MDQPSSTITAATLAGMGMAVGWELLSQFTTLEPRPALVAGSVSLVSAAVGYFKREHVLEQKFRVKYADSIEP